MSNKKDDWATLTILQIQPHTVGFFMLAVGTRLMSYHFYQQVEPLEQMCGQQLLPFFRLGLIAVSL